MTIGEDNEIDEGFRVWRRALEALLKQGATHAEAIDGANLVLRAYLRGHAEPDDEAPSSGRGSARHQ